MNPSNDEKKPGRGNIERKERRYRRKVNIKNDTVTKTVSAKVRIPGLSIRLKDASLNRTALDGYFKLQTTKIIDLIKRYVTNLKYKIPKLNDLDAVRLRRYYNNVLSDLILAKVGRQIADGPDDTDKQNLRALFRELNTTFEQIFVDRFSLPEIMVTVLMLFGPFEFTGRVLYPKFLVDEGLKAFAHLAQDPSEEETRHMFNDPAKLLEFMKQQHLCPLRRGILYVIGCDSNAQALELSLKLFEFGDVDILPSTMEREVAVTSGEKSVKRKAVEVPKDFVLASSTKEAKGDGTFIAFRRMAINDLSDIHARLDALQSHHYPRRSIGKDDLDEPGSRAQTAYYGSIHDYERVKGCVCSAVDASDEELQLGAALFGTTDPNFDWHYNKYAAIVKEDAKTANELFNSLIDAELKG